MTCRSSAAEIEPDPSLSNTLNASRSSSSASPSFLLRAIMAEKRGAKDQCVVTSRGMYSASSRSGACDESGEVAPTPRQAPLTTARPRR